MLESDEVLLAMADAVSGGGDWLRATCPFCPTILGKNDKRRSLGINNASGYYHCFRCRTVGRLNENDEWAPVEATEKPAPEEVQVGPPDEFIPMWASDALTSRACKPVLDYLYSRGLSNELIRQAGIGACLTGYYANRIVVPIYADDDETWLGFSARDWTNTQELRYRYPPNMQRGTIMYNHRLLTIETDEPAMVCEGVFDALPYYDIAAACLGKPSRWQVDEMMSAKRPLAIVLDGDACSESEALARRLIFAGRRAGWVRLPAGRDPNTVNNAWLRSAIVKCMQ